MQIERWLAALLSGALALACESSRDPGVPGGGGGSGGGGGGGSDGGGGGGGTSDGTASLALLAQASGGPPHATRLDLTSVATVVYVDRSSAWQDADSPCDSGGGERLDGAASPSIDLSGGRTPVVSFDRSSGGQLREVDLVLQEGVLVRDNRGYKVHAGTLCTMPDGRQYTLLRLRPATPVDLGGGADYDLVAGFDPGSIRISRVDCPGSGAEECAVGDDPEDDDDPSTRLVFTFGGEVPLAAEKR
jgi:hypothetical protein